jgi:ankyrin repeat protein
MSASAPMIRVGKFVDFSPSPSYPLHQIAYLGDLEALETRLKELRKQAPGSPQLLGGDANGYTPMTCAALAGHVAAVSLLFKETPSSALPGTKDGYTALHMLCGRTDAAKKPGYDKLLRQLAALELPSALCDSPLHVAVDAHNAVAVRALLETRSSAQWLDARTVALGWTAMHLAAKHGSVSTLKLLVAGGANPFAQSDCIGRPLDVAQCARQADAEQYLLELDRDAAATIALAVGARVKELKAALKTAPSHVCAADANGLTVLHHLCAQSATAVVQWLFEQPRARAALDINARDSRRWTPLHYAASGGDARLVMLMLSSSADPNAVTNATSMTPLHFLTACLATTQEEADRLLQCMQAMRAQRVNFNARNARGETPLLLACGRGNANFVSVLLQSGADVDISATDAAGASALMLAKRQNARSIVDMLERRGYRDASAVLATLHEDDDGGGGGGTQGASMAFSTRQAGTTMLSDDTLGSLPPQPASPRAIVASPGSPRGGALAADGLLRLNDVCVLHVLLRVRARDLAILYRVCRRLAALVARPEVLESAARRSGLPPGMPLNYLMRQFGWAELASLRNPEPSMSVPLSTIKVVLLGEPGVGRHALVHCLIAGGLPPADLPRRDSYTCVVFNGVQPFRLVVEVPPRGSMSACEKCDALMLCFDAARPETFEKCVVWEDAALGARLTADSLRTTVVGTRSDAGVAVSSDLLNASEHQPVVLTSALLDRNVSTAFQVLLMPLASAMRARRQSFKRSSSSISIASAAPSSPTNSPPVGASTLQKSTSTRKAAFMRVFSSNAIKTKK